jgi:hypothetical protein
MTGHASRLIPAFLLVCGCALPLSASPAVTFTWHRRRLVLLCTFVRPRAGRSHRCMLKSRGELCIFQFLRLRVLRSWDSAAWC